MKIVCHRINEVSLLESVAPGQGAEIDIRSAGGDLMLAHDPFKGGISLDAFLETFSQSHLQDLLILNTKEDGLEDIILNKLRAHQVEQFFFLDLTLPTLVRMAYQKKEKRLAIRVSEYEPVEAAELFAGVVEWVWLDCFSGKPAEISLVQHLRRSFKVCLVSPELQGYPSARIKEFTHLSHHLDAVCTKFPAKWT